MQIRELTLKTDINTLDDPAKVLKKYGWNVIGVGMEAAVAEHPNKSYVLKLFEDDSNYKAFVQFAVNHRGNPHVPVFFRGIETRDLTKIDEKSNISIQGLMSTIPGTDYSYVRMEKLSRITEKDLVKKYTPEMMFLYLEGIRLNTLGLNYELKELMRKKVIIEFRLFSSKKSFNTDFINKLAADDTKREELWTKLGRKPDPSWMAVATDLLQLSKKVKTTGLDIHEDNVMLRNTVLVITDPFY